MTKKRNDAQLTLDFNRSNPTRATSASVIPFVDSATLQARRTAMQRVVRNGIFGVPKMRG